MATQKMYRKTTRCGCLGFSDSPWVTELYMIQAITSDGDDFDSFASLRRAYELVMDKYLDMVAETHYCPAPGASYISDVRIIKKIKKGGYLTFLVEETESMNV